MTTDCPRSAGTDVTSGRHRVHSYREMLNAIFSVLRSGYAWRMLPHNVPPWQTVYHSVPFGAGNGMGPGCASMLPSARTCALPQGGRRNRALRFWIASRSTRQKTGASGDDAGNNVHGRTRHLLVDALGVVVTVVVHAADRQDRDGARLVVGNAHGKRSCVQVMWADGGDAGQLGEWVQYVGGWTLDIIKRPTGASHFQVAPKRWVVERTVAWLGTYRRLRKDDDARTAPSEAFIYVAMIHVRVRRLTRIHINDSS